eukprot:768436-Hanusia_phi.AAC.1
MEEETERERNEEEEMEEETERERNEEEEMEEEQERSNKSDRMSATPCHLSLTRSTPPSVDHLLLLESPLLLLKLALLSRSGERQRRDRGVDQRGQRG